MSDALKFPRGGSGVTAPLPVHLLGKPNPYTLSTQEEAASSLVFLDSITVPYTVIVPNEGGRDVLNATPQGVTFQQNTSAGRSRLIAPGVMERIAVAAADVRYIPYSLGTVFPNVTLPTANQVFNFDAQLLSGYSSLDPVSAWGSPGTAFVAQGTGSARPIYQASSINGRPAVAFDGIDDVLTISGANASFTNAATLYIVARVTGTQYSLFETYNASDGFWRYGDGYGYLHAFRSARANLYPPNQPSSGIHVFALVSSAATYTFYRDGVAIAGDRSLDFSAGSTIYKIGNGGGGGPALADFGQIAAYNAEHSATTVAENVQTLVNRWGIT